MVSARRLEAAGVVPGELQARVVGFNDSAESGTKYPITVNLRHSEKESR
jgi:hypothetical protein